MGLNYISGTLVLSSLFKVKKSALYGIFSLLGMVYSCTKPIHKQRT